MWSFSSAGQASTSAADCGQRAGGGVCARGARAGVLHDMHVTPPPPLFTLPPPPLPPPKLAWASSKGFRVLGFLGVF
jgi:hypothetical protein